MRSTTRSNDLDVNRKKELYPIQLQVINYIDKGETIPERIVKLYVEDEEKRVRDYYPHTEVSANSRKIRAVMLGKVGVLVLLPSANASTWHNWRYVTTQSFDSILLWYAKGAKQRAPTITHFSDSLKAWNTGQPADILPTKVTRLSPPPSPSPPVVQHTPQPSPSLPSNVLTTDHLTSMFEFFRRERVEEQALHREELARIEKLNHDMLTALVKEKERGRSMSRGRRSMRPPEESLSIEAIADKTDPGMEFASNVSRLAQASYSDIYDAALESTEEVGESYSIYNWTWSIRDNTPYYIMNETPVSELYTRRVVVTPKVADMWGASSDEWGIPTDDPSGLVRKYFHRIQSDYVSRTVRDARRNVDIMLKAVLKPDALSNARSIQPITLEMKQKDLADFKYKNRKNPAVRIRYSTGGDVTSVNSLTPALYSQIHPDDTHYYDKEGEIRAFGDQMVYFGGMVTVWEVTAETAITTIEQYKKIVEYVLYKNLVSEMERSEPIYFVLQARYTAYDDATNKLLMDKPVTYWQGIVSEDSNIDFSILATTIEDLLENYGYEYDKSSRNATLDLTRFVVKRIDLTSYGGIRLNTRGMSVDDLMDKFNAKKVRKQVYTLDFATVQTLNHSNNACFVAALAEFLKNKHLRSGGKENPYTKLYKEVGKLRGYEGREVPVERAMEVANELGLHVEIYNNNGVIIHASKSTNPAPQLDTVTLDEEQRTLRLLYHEDHYVLILQLKAITKAEEFVDKNKSVSLDSYTKIIGYYDIETIISNHTSVIPYANAYEVCCSLDGAAYGKKGITINHKPTLDVFTPMMHDMMSVGPGHHHYLVAYNGSKFDHIQLFQYIIEAGYDIHVAPNPVGSSHTYTFILPCPRDDAWVKKEYMRRVGRPNTARMNEKQRKQHEKKTTQTMKILKRGVSFVTVWDPVLFIRKPLAAAARDYKVPVHKGVLDHEEVQRYYERGELEVWLSKHDKEIREYNEKDVEVLKLVTLELFKALETITKVGREEIVNTPTISGFAFNWWSEYEENSELFKAVKDPALDKIVRSAIVAGRVEGDVGVLIADRDDPYILVDVVSLYPGVMKMFNYPYGEARPIYTIEEAVARADMGCLGIYSCTYDQSNLEGRHPILPTKNEDGRYDWKTPSSGTKYLPTPTMNCLRDNGCHVIIDTPLEPYSLTFTEDKPSPDRVREINEIDPNAKVDKKGNVTFKEERMVYAIVWEDPYDDYVRLLRAYGDDNVSVEEYARMKEDYGSVLASHGSITPFEAYIKMLENEKNRQDELIAKGEGNPALREMIKMLLNSLSGKVAQRNFTNKSVLVKGSEQLKDVFLKLVAPEPKNGEIVTKKGVGKIDVDIVTTVGGSDVAFVSWNVSEEEAYNPNRAKPSQLAVFIYAYARKYMYDNVFSKMHVCYTDTDSALIKLSDYKALIDDRLKPIDVDNDYRKVDVRRKQFGDYEIETMAGGAFLVDEAIIVAPKTYLLKSEGKVVKYKCKGIRREDKFIIRSRRGVDDWVKISDNPEEFFKRLNYARIMGESVSIKTKVWGRSYGKGRMIGTTIHEQIKEIRP